MYNVITYRILHVTAKIINQEGKLEALSLGFAEPKDRGIQGYVEALKDAVSIIFDTCFYVLIFSCRLRSRELRDIAKSDSLQLHKLPKLLEVRWSEFNSSSLESVLVSWRALVNYFKTGTDQSLQGYHKYLTTI